MRIAVFQQNGSGEEKIKGISRFGRGIEISRVFTVGGELPELIEEPEDYVDADFEVDLVLNFFKHPDLSDYLVRLCRTKGIPVIAAGKKQPGAISPFTCCGLGRHKGLGAYGEQFGFPEFEATVEGGRITALKVLRGASCGATWQILPKIIGQTVDRALALAGRETQYLCHADPSAFDPVSGKSALHYAGEVHAQALKKAVDDALKKM